MAGSSSDSETLVVTLHGIEIPVKEYWIWELYDFKCLMCGRWAVCLHEAPPRSKNPRWEEMPETRFPVCNQHHNELHEMNWKVAGKLLVNLRNGYFPETLERIEEWKRKNLSN